jgi:hypothetical protein
MSHGYSARKAIAGSTTPTPDRGADCREVSPDSLRKTAADTQVRNEAAGGKAGERDS